MLIYFYIFHHRLTDNPQLKFDSVRITALVRLGFIVAATLIVAGGGLAQKPEGRYLTVAGNALFAVILVVMILILLLIWRASEKLIPYTKKVCPSLPSSFLTPRMINDWERERERKRDRANRSVVLRPFRTQSLQCRYSLSVPPTL